MTTPKPSPGRYSGKRLEFKIGYVLPIDDKRVVFSLLASHRESEE